MIDETQWIELREAANQLHICTRQLWNYRRRRRIRSITIGRTVYLWAWDVRLAANTRQRCGRPRIYSVAEQFDSCLWWPRRRVRVLVKDLSSVLAGYSPPPAAPWVHLDRTSLRQVRNGFARLAAVLEDARSRDDLTQWTARIVLDTLDDELTAYAVLYECSFMLDFEDLKAIIDTLCPHMIGTYPGWIGEMLYLSARPEVSVCIVTDRRHGAEHVYLIPDPRPPSSDADLPFGTCRPVDTESPT